MRLAIAHLYPDLLRTYGDRGNIIALRRRAEWRGLEVAVEAVSARQPIPSYSDIVLIGGGTDRVQEAVATDLLQRRDELERTVASGGVVLGICGGYQLLGRRYVAADGTVIGGVGLLDVETVAGSGRIIGNVRVEAVLWGLRLDLYGFENHGGRTYLGPGADPLGTANRGHGNNGQDGSEGAVQGNVLGTYLHGPVLPANPKLADAVMARVLASHGDVNLSPLPDRLEEEARRLAKARCG